MFSRKPTIAFITTSRADFGLLSPVLEIIRHSDTLDSKLIVSGSHLSVNHGFTVNEIKRLGHPSDIELPLVMGNSTGLDVSSMVSDAVTKFANTFDDLKPDLIFLLGDRTEIFAAAQAAVYMHIPIAHYFGGDSASGTYDNLFRHCITKLSSLHFVSSVESRKRVLQLGEDENNVFIVGSTAVENIRSNVNDDKGFFQKIGLVQQGPLFLITYHPLTMTNSDSLTELNELLAALTDISFSKNVTIIFTAANTDEGGEKINTLIKSFVQTKPNYYFFKSLGMKNYLNLMSRADVVIGNSSSGIYEAPILGIPSVDIGERQKGRFPNLRSVIRTAAQKKDILKSIKSALNVDKKSVTHCFGDGDSAKKMVSILERFDRFSDLNMKSFHDLF